MGIGSQECQIKEIETGINLSKKRHLSERVNVARELQIYLNSLERVWNVPRGPIVLLDNISISEAAGVELTD